MRLSSGAGLARAVALAALALLPSCAVNGLAFRTDTRVDILEPADRADLELPVTMRWSARDIDGGAFGVFIDRSPPPPGRTVASLFSGDEACELTPGCPDDAYLAERNIFITTSRSLTIERLSTIGVDPDRELHLAVIVLLDGDGRRIGESAFDVEFRLEREQ